MNNKKYIVSPCGTSLLTNQAENTEQRSLVFKYANEKQKENIPDNDRAALEALIGKATVMIEKADYQAAAAMSAELNGIIQIYDGVLPQKSDFHFLLSTDTWLGEETANLVQSWLQSNSDTIITMVHRHTDLQTSDISAFQLSLSELIRKFSDELPEYSKNGYTIIFNLTGGFKSVQGFLQSIANFYADETVYIFETSSTLLKIPRLPVTMDAVSIVEKNIYDFRNFAAEAPVTVSHIFPEILLFTLEGMTMLSPWGELMWTESKDEVYAKSLLPSPGQDKIRYGRNFTKNIGGLPADRLVILNNRIDQLHKYLYNRNYNPDSLDFKRLQGKPVKSSTHELDAWSDLDAKRIFGHFEESVFVLDRLDKGLH